MLGSVYELRDVIREVGAECVFVAASALSAREMGYVAKAVRLEGVEVRITATLPEVLSSRVAVQSLGGVTALSLRPVRLTGTQAVVKRAFDVRRGQPERRDPDARVMALLGHRREGVVVGARALSPDAGGAARPAVHDGEVPHDARGRRRRWWRTCARATAWTT